MTWRRLRAVPALTGIVLLFVMPFGLPAHAATAESQAAKLDVTIDTPGANQKLSTPSATVSGTVSTKTLISAVTYITYVEVNFLYNGSRIHTTVFCEGCDNQTTVQYSVPSPSLDLNGPYTVEVRAAGRVILQGLNAEGSATRSFVVAVPPAPPTGVTATPQPDRTVKLAWTAPATTADFLGYVVYRKTGTAPFAALAVTKQTTYTDTTTTALTGAVQYQVASVREGAVPGNAETALQTPSASVVATLPPLPTTSTVPGATTTTAPIGGGNQEGGAASVNLGDLLPAKTAPPPTFPPPPPPPTIPDTGFSVNLPFPSSSATTPGFGADVELDPEKVEGRQLGNAGGTSGAGEVDGGGDDANRRALLVPVAAGSVLCVTALHLRWLNRRVLSAGAGALATSGTAGDPAAAAAPDLAGEGIADLEPIPPAPEPAPDVTVFMPEPEPEPVRVGAGPRP